MGQVFTITDTKSHTYFDQGGHPISGYKVYFNVHEFGEGHDIDVPDVKDTDHIEERIMEVIEARRKIAALGG